LALEREPLLLQQSEKVAPGGADLAVDLAVDGLELHLDHPEGAGEGGLDLVDAGGVALERGAVGRRGGRRRVGPAPGEVPEIEQRGEEHRILGGDAEHGLPPRPRRVGGLFAARVRSGRGGSGSGGGGGGGGGEERGRRGSGVRAVVEEEDRPLARGGCGCGASLGGAGGEGDGV